MGMTARRSLGRLAQGRRKDAGALVHRLKGAAGSMALTTVWRHADSLEQTLGQEGKAAATRVQDLQEALEAARYAITAYAGRDPATPEEATPDETISLRLVDDLLRALDRDNPDEAEPILDGLSGKLPADRLAALQERLDAFDFRGAEAVVRALVARPAIIAEEAPNETRSNPVRG